ncbi:MAG: anti-sigma factor family protein [Acidobacteriota bacterium]
MNCKEFVDFMMAYLNGNLPADQKTEFEGHIGDCPPCIHYLETYRDTITLSRAAYDDPDAPMTPEPPEKLVQAILAARRKGAAG